MLDGIPHLLTLDKIDTTWMLIKHKVIEEHFGPNIVAVPFLSDAACYDLLGVLVKQSHTDHTRLPLPVRQGRWVLQPVGLLPNLLEQTGSDGTCAHCTWEYSPNGRAETAYEEMRLLDGQPCQIRLHMGGLRKKVTFLLLPPGQFSLQPKGVVGPQKPLTKDPLPHGAKWVRPNFNTMPPLAPTQAPANTSKVVDIPPPVLAPPPPPPQEEPENRLTRLSYKG
ncbi:hypothetical protein MUG91_G277n8 [Manis pentadactyla]|nr:hypothetical protein MUG91_G277n8 [Manis pentadactyla]